MIPQNSTAFREASQTISMFLGSATVPVAPVGVPPTDAEFQSLHCFGEQFHACNAFGETPKGAGEDARAPRIRSPG
jgi:hypothetical protein